METLLIIFGISLVISIFIVNKVYRMFMKVTDSDAMKVNISKKIGAYIVMSIILTVIVYYVINL